LNPLLESMPVEGFFEKLKYPGVDNPDQHSKHPGDFVSVQFAPKASSHAQGKLATKHAYAAGRDKGALLIRVSGRLVVESWRKTENAHLAR